jgi:serine/threonine protein phosphatase 1
MNAAEKNYKRIIAVGDLHGNSQPLKELLSRIQVTDRDLIIFIGDYIDRGPETKLVIEELIRLRSFHPNLIFLKGNHEDMMLGAMGFNAVIKDVNTWLYNGGTQTLISYGMNRDEILLLSGKKVDDKHNGIIKNLLPRSHVEFLEELIPFAETEHFFFCHAGVNPGNTLLEGKQILFDLLWMRDHIYSDEFAWDKTVVCGHTPLRDVLIKEKLICIDTGLYCYGTLSAIDVLTNQLYQVYRF